MIQVLTKLEQTSDERSQETSNLQLKIYRLVCTLASSSGCKSLKISHLCASVDSRVHASLPFPTLNEAHGTFPYPPYSIVMY
jgi:hypothetical protein